MALPLLLGACTAGEALQNARNLGQRYVDQTKRTLDTRATMHAHEMALTEEWCGFLSADARAKKDALFGNEALREAMVAMIDGDQELAVGLLSEEREIDQEEVARAYDNAIRCYQNRPPILRLREYRDSVKAPRKSILDVYRGPAGEGA